MEFGDCERCGKRRNLFPNQICQECLDDMERIKKDPALLKSRLTRLKRMENGIIQSGRSKMLLETHQSPQLSQPTFEKIGRARDLRREAKASRKENLLKFFESNLEEISSVRPDNYIELEVSNFNGEYFRWLATHPNAMHELSPRRFEEVIADILKDQGHSVELTQQTRDGGYDIIAVMNTGFGKILTIVECKRWLPPTKVGIGVIERFLHVVKDKVKANRGIIAATTQFSADAKKRAAEYNYQLQLADFDLIKTMAGQYGTWHTHKKSEIWVPDY